MNRRNFLTLAGVPVLAAGQPAAVLHARVVDKATGETIPATVRVRTSAGEILRESEAFTGGFRTPGEFRKQVPPGTTTVRISRGFDFDIWEQELILGPGEQRRVVIPLVRRTPLLKEGWRCGDNHVHMIHGESRIAVDFEYLGMAAAAEALDYMSVAQRWKLREQTAEAAEAECRRVSRPGCTLMWNMEAPKNYFRGNVTQCLGHCWFVGARPRDAQGRDLVEQLSAMSAGDYQSDKTPAPNFESHALIHAQGGAISYTHPCRWWWGKWGGRGIYPVEQRKFVSNMAQELPFDTLAGPTYDAIDILMQTREKEVNASGLQLWYLLLNHGYRMPATASTDATFDNPGRGMPGKVRVYTKTGGSFSMPRLAAAMKAGRNFVTSGPLLTIDVGGHQPGEVLTVTKPTTVTVRLRAWAAPGSESRLSEVELIQNGISVRRLPVNGSRLNSAVDWTLEGSGWIIARCFGKDRDHEVAITNPVYWEPPGARVPQPVPANVVLRVTDPAGNPVNGVCTVLQRIGFRERTVSTVKITNGQARFQAPATARLRISAPGFRPAMKSIFLDTPELLEPTLNMRPDQLLAWSTFQKLATVLSDIRIKAELQRG